MDLSSWFTDTLTTAALTGRGTRGEPTYGAQSTIRGRLERKQQRVVDKDGQQVPSDAVFATDVAVDVQDRFWFPGTDTAEVNEARTPVTVSRAFNNDRSLELFEVFF